MSAWIVSVLVSLALAVLWHGVSLKVACALAGEDSPGFARTAVVSWLGGLMSAVVGTAWAFTFGIVVSLFISSWLSAGIGLVLGLLTAATVYRQGLKLSGPASLGVAAIHLALTFAFNMLLGGVLYFGSGFGSGFGF